MKLNILLFAGLADRLGDGQISIELEADTITASGLLQHLMKKFPEHADALKPCFFAKNREYAEPGQMLEEQDELALIPPVSGGQDATDGEQAAYGKAIPLFVLTNEPVQVEEVTSKVLHPDHGATLAFIGTTRELTEGKRTVRLEYEAYVPMAVRTLQQIGDEIGLRWSGVRCAITHRLGLVEIGETSVVIAVSAPHRNDCYEASRYAIERLKQIVPIWKKECWEDGTEWKGRQLGPWNPVE